MGIPPEPLGFRDLCERVGLALMLGQKVQYALAGYYATFMSKKNHWTIDQAKKQLEYHLSKPMGIVVADIEKHVPLPEGLWLQVKEFKECRNWLVHEFDEEATPYLARGEHILEYKARMEGMILFATSLMSALDGFGKEHFGI
jgi:hypothetical protein